VNNKRLNAIEAFPLSFSGQAPMEKIIIPKGCEQEK
jgi:hypothetical protein